MWRPPLCPPSAPPLPPLCPPLCPPSATISATINATISAKISATYLPRLSQVIRHEPYGTGCDVYSFAILCWEMVTYSIPFPRRSPIEVAPSTMTLPTHYAYPPLPTIYTAGTSSPVGSVALGSQDVTIPCLLTLPLAY